MTVCLASAEVFTASGMGLPRGLPRRVQRLYNRRLSTPKKDRQALKRPVDIVVAPPLWCFIASFCPFPRCRIDSFFSFARAGWAISRTQRPGNAHGSCHRSAPALRCSVYRGALRGSTRTPCPSGWPHALHTPAEGHCRAI